MLSRALLVAASRSARQRARQHAPSSSAHASADSSSESGDESPRPGKHNEEVKPRTTQQEEKIPHSSEPSSSSRRHPQSIDFGDTRKSFSSVPTAKLLRSAVTLGACAYSPPWLVDRAAAAYTGSASSTSSSGIFPSVVGAFISRALYPHFCAGSTAEEASRVADELAEKGVGSILNYAAEEAVEDGDEGAGNGVDVGEGSRGERRRDAAAELFLASVDGARPSPRPGRPSWVAIKMSALAPPAVLERASAAIVAASEEAARRSGDDSPLYDRGHWACDDALSGALERCPSPEASGSGRRRPLLDEADVSALFRGEQRLRRIASAASNRGNTRVIVDAEQTWLQPIIDVLALRAMREFNAGFFCDPSVFQTYQCYLRSTQRRVEADAARAAEEGFALCAKPVRGAYLSAERSLASSKGVPCPVHPSIRDTHACYDAVVRSLLDGVGGGRAHLLVASHNRESVERAVEGMRSRGLLPELGSGSGAPPPCAPVSFGQLLGMADSLTFGLAARGLDALKILAYGDLGVVCSFLVRRAQENASALGGARAESRAQAREVVRRVASLFSSPSGAK